MKVTCLRGFNFDFPEYGEYSSSFFFSLYFVRCVLLANSLRCAFFFLQKNLWLNIQTERVTERERESEREKERERKLFMIKQCASAVRLPRSPNTLIYSSLTAPKGDCNIKNKWPFFQPTASDGVRHTAHM